MARAFLCFRKLLSLFGAAGFDAGPRGSEERTCASDDGKDCGWILGGVSAAVLGVEREGDGKKKCEAEKRERNFLH